MTPDHQFRPLGFQPGHHAEWAKLLSGIARLRCFLWLIDRAFELLDDSLPGWDGD